MLLPRLLILAHSAPEPMGLAPDGAAMDTNSHLQEYTGLTRSQAFRTPTFYIIAACLFSLSMLVTTLHFENKGILMSHGLSSGAAASMFTVTGIAAAISMPIVGRLLDRVPTERMLASGLLVMGGSLFSATLVVDLKSAIVYALIFGTNNGITMTYFTLRGRGISVENTWVIFKVLGKWSGW